MKFADLGFVVLTTGLLASPAFAGIPTPAPIAGVGFAGFVAVAAGYRYLRKRLER